MSKKKKILLLVISIIIVVAIAVGIILWFMPKEQKSAEENYENWKKIYEMTTVLDEKLAQTGYHEFLGVPRWYEGYDCAEYDDIEPHVSKNFMTKQYEMLFAGLTWENDVVMDCWEDGKQVFTQMNHELNEISAYVIHEIESGNNAKDLMTDDTELYKTVQEKLDVFCKTHAKIVDDFWDRVQQKEAEIESTGECSKWKIEMRAENVTPTGLTLILTRDNPEEDAADLLTGEMYFLEKKKGSQWELVDPIIDEFGWNMIAHLIFPESTREWEIDWEWLYGELPPGTYRIGKNVQIDGNYKLAEEIGYHKVYYAEFEID